MREGEPLLDDVGDFLARRDQLEDPAIDLPVTDLLGPVRVVAQIGDVQPVVEIVEHDATFAAEHADRPGLVQRLNVSQVNLLAPVAGSRFELQIFRWRAGGEQDDVRIRWADASLVGRSLVTGQQSVSHVLRSPRQSAARPARRNGR
jgi:hypothetical protein